MVSFENLIKRIDTAFAQNTKLKISASDIENLSVKEIDAVYEAIKMHSLSCIEKAHQSGLLDDESAAYLSNIYSNARENRQELYKNITDTLLTEYRQDKLRRLEQLGEEPAPEEINSIDLDTGKIEKNTSVSENSLAPKYKEYRPCHITPFTDMRLTFYDLRDNPVYVIMPGIKDVRRAIDKIKLPVLEKDSGQIISHGGKYYQLYEKEMAALRAQCSNEQEFQRRAAKVTKPHEYLKDVERFTIARKYYMDTEETLDLFCSDPRYGVDRNEVKDSFNGNSNNGNYNSKNYRDKKMYMHIAGHGNPIVVESQIKITKLYDGDFDTHHIYAGESETDKIGNNEIFITRQNTKGKGLRYWEESLHNFSSLGDRLVAKKNIYHKKLAIQKRNKEAIRAYNLQVIDKAFRLEDAKLANGRDYDLSYKNPKSGKMEHAFRVAADFITNNFIYRPFKAYDNENAFSVTDEELKAAGLLINAKQIKEFTERYSKFIIPKYYGRISGHEVESFHLPEQQEYIKTLFKKYGYNERRIDETFPDNDELDVLRNFNKKAILGGGR